jgi:hypothetical protein
MGDTRVDNPALIVVEQPNSGSLFKSQNDSTWTPSQLDDLAFILHRAVFDTSLSGQVDLVNVDSNPLQLPPNPFRIRDTSSKVRVLHPNHGFEVGMFVSFTGAVAPVTAFNSTWTVTKVISPDEYVFDCGSAQSVTGITGFKIATVGGTAVIASTNRRVDEYRLIIDEVKFPGGIEVQNTIQQSSAIASDGTFSQTLNSVEVANTSPKFIHSPVNELQVLGGAKSATVRLNLVSGTDFLSPVVDLSTPTMVAITNRIDNKDTTVIDTAEDAITVFPAANMTFVATDPNNSALVNYATTSADVSRIVIGAYTTISGTASNNATGVGVRVLDVDVNPALGVNRVYFDKTIVGEGPVSTTLAQYDTFVDEISPFAGTRAAKYQISPIILSTISSAIKVLFSSNIGSAADIDLYYRSTMESSTNPLSIRPWVKVTNFTYKKSLNRLEFVDYSFSVEGMKAFNAVQVKIVMKSTSTASIPKFKDLRVIALA